MDYRYCLYSQVIRIIIIIITIIHISGISFMELHTTLYVFPSSLAMTGRPLTNDWPTSFGNTTQKSQSVLFLLKDTSAYLIQASCSVFRRRVYLSLVKENKVVNSTWQGCFSTVRHVHELSDHVDVDVNLASRQEATQKP